MLSHVNTLLVYHPDFKGDLSMIYTKRTLLFVHVQTVPHGRNMHAT